MSWYLWLSIVLWPFTLIGLFTAFHLMRGMRPPVDKSNRFNVFRLWWYALTRQEQFVWLFPWLRDDEFERMGFVMEAHILAYLLDKAKERAQTDEADR